ncbi:hypothetical protein ACNHUS_35895 [Actinomycetes bacterium M1A6_2h]
MVSTEQEKGAPPLAVGSRVRTKYSTDRTSDPSTWEYESGKIVQDFAENLDGSINRDWARAHRWGIALDNGCLVFRDNDDVTADR